ncbi:spore maturation protein [Alicyclobacillus acidocaldarius]|uniref:Nucleoside recognition domain protein n=1 Tax=Alicyclobacillus acidocaldarius (strain Tc-4-1) TaxID=1048834 RepID=F8IKI1_ALIAT|nr:nucleoside recognition domain-containing protein [Alicyclobacillus acidocaldarius]AEJ43559.1 nucleoside recognition domain protein [Alicyclobacillus acidocaldarius subsp. acidocaldarius Tc-4-1]
MSEALAVISEWTLPLVVSLILVIGAWRRVPIYQTFVQGAKGGFSTAIRLIPHLVAMMVAVSVFRASGAMDGLVQLLDPVLTWLHVPAEVAPMGILRPITGQGSLAFMIDIFRKHGPDSHLGLLASTMQASSDTTLYILTVYFGSVGIYRFRYALAVGLMSDFVSVLASVFAVWLVSGMIQV